MTSDATRRRCKGSESREVAFKSRAPARRVSPNYLPRRRGFGACDAREGRQPAMAEDAVRDDRWATDRCHCHDEYFDQQVTAWQPRTLREYASEGRAATEPAIPLNVWWACSFCRVRRYPHAAGSAVKTRTHNESFVYWFRKPLTREQAPPNVWRHLFPPSRRCDLPHKKSAD